MLATGIPVDSEAGSHVRELIMPGGKPGYDALVEIDGDRKRSNAGFVGEIATLNWPITPTDTPLEAGRPHTLVFGITDEVLDYQPGWMQISVLLKSDPDTSGGVLPIDLIFYGGEDLDPELRTGAVGAVQRWSDLYEQAGITLEVTTRELGGGALPPPIGLDSPLWRSIGASGPPGHLRVVVSPDMADDDRSIVGVTGDIPAPLIPSGRSGIRVIPNRLCGQDGICDVGEQRLFGELLAHETGHYLGLFHPVETSWDNWDALSDTVECMGPAPCEDSLGSNVMFPYPVCDGDGCRPLEELSTQQRAVMNGYVGVD